MSDESPIDWGAPGRLAQQLYKAGPEHLKLYFQDTTLKVWDFWLVYGHLWEEDQEAVIRLVSHKRRAMSVSFYHESDLAIKTLMTYMTDEMKVEALLRVIDDLFERIIARLSDTQRDMLVDIIRRYQGSRECKYACPTNYFVDLIHVEEFPSNLESSAHSCDGCSRPYKLFDGIVIGMCGRHSVHARCHFKGCPGCEWGRKEQLAYRYGWWGRTAYVEPV